MQQEEGVDKSKRLSPAKYLTILNVMSKAKNNRHVQSAGRLKQPIAGGRITDDLLNLAELSVNSGSWSWNLLNGDIVWSRGMFNLFGLDPASDAPSFEVWLSRVHPEDRKTAQNIISTALKNKTYMYNHYRIIRDEGQVRWIDAYGDLTFNKHGQPHRMSGFCIDVTKRILLELENKSLGSDIQRIRRMEEALRKNEERLELALTGTGLALWDWDIPMRRVYGGSHWHKLLGYAKGELGEKEEDWLALIHQQDIGQFRRNLQSCLSGDLAMFQSEHRLRHRDGHWIHVEGRGNVSHRSKDGTPLRMIGTVRDVSLNKKLHEDGIVLLKKIEAMIINATSSTPNSSAENETAEGLSRRQRQILVMISKGMTSAGIAKQLKIAIGTAIVHRRELMKKLGLHKAADVTRFALRHKLIDN